MVIILAVTALAAGLRLWHLSSPHTYVFDEVYYAKDGCYDAGFPYKQCGLAAPGEQTFTVHPPLGRWIIAAGEKALGDRSFGWRIASAVFGTFSVLIVSLLALQLFESAVWAGASGLLLATEGLNFVQSRVSMLDIFVTTFLLAAFLFLVLDRKWIERRTPLPPLLVRGPLDPFDLPADRPPSPLWRPWR
ncbi:MAG TPA: phospholipid carrier-dependent glycosyltransferase, partial [Candidatus Polarisedimenticolia bacterium]|nr:phospholipid carrier-dependent glycosyltransferase [Candidatus Polarisedimenticolia bacterium]